MSILVPPGVPVPVLSPQQESFLSALQANQSSLLLDARAGSGKTYTLTRGAALAAPGLALAFNRRNADDLATKFPPVWHTKTMNGLGHQVWATHISRNVNLQTKKLWDLTKSLSHIPFRSRIDVVRLAEAAKTLGYVPAAARGGVAWLPRGGYGLRGGAGDGAAAIAWEDVEDLADTDDPDGALREWTDQLLLESIRLAWLGTIDFSDQIYMSTIWGARFPRYLSLVVDEAQDLSPLQHRMATLSLHEQGRAYLAGDAHQAIYAWRGADADSLFTLAKTFGASRLPLTVSFRCPQEVIREAKVWVPDIEAAPTAPLGEVHGSMEDPLTSLPLAAFHGAVTVLCRNNAPNLKLFFRLLRRGIPSTILGRDFLAGLKSYIKKHGRPSVAATVEAIREDSISAITIAKANEDDNKIDRIIDRRESIVVLATGFASPGAGVDDFLAFIDRLFSERKEAPLLLSTIHKAKGMEWPNVIILGPRLFKPARAQEPNLIYVAITRAQQRLTWLADDFVFEQANGARQE